MDASYQETDEALQRRLTQAAGAAGDADFLYAHCANELLSRLDWLRIEPERIADLGAGAAGLSAALAERFPAARVAAVELNDAQARGIAPRGWRPRWLRGRADVERVRAPLARLPFDDASIDLAVSNLSLARYAEPDSALAEIARVLKPGGGFAFVTPGPDTLRELREAWRCIDDESHVAAFLDMHDLGDALGRAGLAEPVLDVVPLDLRYRRIEDFWRDLTRLGARNSLPDRRRGLTGRRGFETMCRQLAGTGEFSVSVELVFGQCWGAPSRPQASPGEVRISPQAIGRRR